KELKNGFSAHCRRYFGEKMIFRLFVDDILAKKRFFGSLSTIFWEKNDFSALCRRFFGGKIVFQLFVDD
ncbi:hypothetical protein, partial [Porphyromonas loveana]|uniref:hypothetical protein n=1 Tax=Porphyromonas loveana TaxID=1884669 RepID=UPI00359F8EAB